MYVTHTKDGILRLLVTEHFKDGEFVKVTKSKDGIVLSKTSKQPTRRSGIYKAKDQSSAIWVDITSSLFGLDTLPVFKGREYPAEVVNGGHVMISISGEESVSTSDIVDAIRLINHQSSLGAIQVRMEEDGQIFAEHVIRKTLR